MSLAMSDVRDELIRLYEEVRVLKERKANIEREKEAIRVEKAAIRVEKIKVEKEAITFIGGERYEVVSSYKAPQVYCKQL